MHGLAAADLALATAIAAQFGEADALEIKAIERETNHDVKAVEYFLKRRLGAHAAWTSRLEFVHFACTSEDINNLAYGVLALRGARRACCCRGSTSLTGTLRAHGARPCRRRDDVAHARPAGDADHARQGGGRVRRTA